MAASVASAAEGLYGGPWLDEAKARIERVRKANLQVRVTRGGAPVEGAEVKVEMTRHAFPFGSAVMAWWLVGNHTEEARRYQSTVTQLFNRVVFENDLKWMAWNNEWSKKFRRNQTLEAAEWLRERGIELRGHCLVWPGWKHLPDALRRYEHDPTGLRRAVEEHLRDVATAMRGKVVDWDVVNETFWNQDLQRILGEAVIDDWFRLARKADPEAKLYINDARILSFSGAYDEHKQHYFDEVSGLVARGAEIDGIGFQCHFRENSLTPPEEVLALLDRYADFGLDLAITEFDILTGDEELQAAYLHDFLHAIFSHPAVTQFIMWSFWEGKATDPSRALYRKDWSAKPAGRVFEKLLFEEWWSREDGLTSGKGLFRSRVFQGDYRIAIAHDGERRSGRKRVGPRGTKLHIELGKRSAKE